MGVAEPEDVTELSSRRRRPDDETRLSPGKATDASVSDPEPQAELGPDDGTVLSTRRREEEPDDDATRMSARQAPAPVADDDVTRFAPRVPVAEPQVGDDTRISNRSSSASSGPRARRSPSTLAPLPPGVIGGAAAERGAFGQPAQEYEARELPEDAPQPRAPEAAQPIPAASAPMADRVRSRREAARHRKLITSVVVVAVTAGLMAVAVIAIVALVNRA